MADFGSVLTKRKLDQIEDETQFSSNKKIKAEKNSLKEDNYSFSDLPPEILHYILSFITSDSQRRHIRSVCQSWFDYINYNEFNIGLLLTSESEEFSRCFGRYQKPFGLKFMKIGKLINMEYIRDKNKNLMTRNYLFQSMLKPLTQLTALDLRLKNFEVPQELVNIQYLTVISPIRGSTVSKLTNLRRLKTDSQIAEIPTTLESLDLSENDQINYITIDSSYSRLTELAISTKTRCDFPDALTNMRKISLFEYNGLTISGTKVNLTNFHLEEFITNVNTEELPDQYPSTLTKLHVLSYGDVKINENLTQLKDLQCFAVKLPNNSHMRMSSLEDYVVQSNNEKILNQLDSQKITTLRITLEPENCHIWKKFTNLIDLDLGLHWLPNDILAYLVPLTRLTKLNLYYANYPQQWMTELPNLVDLKLMRAPGANDSESINFEAMNQLTLLELSGNYKSINIINLTNLLHLDISNRIDSRAIKIHGLSTVTNLTHLSVTHNGTLRWLSKVVEPTELALLTNLRTLQFDRCSNTEPFYIASLTSLKHLTFLEVQEAGHSMWYLTKLSRLQNVSMTTHGPQFDYTSILENLPFCYRFDVKNK